MTKLSAGELAAFLTELAEEEGWLPHNRRKLRACAALLRAQEGWVLVDAGAVSVVCDFAEGQLNEYAYDEGTIIAERSAIEILRRALPAAPGGKNG